ncbi:hypothetical protein E2C01_011153 [Portunus trituberculatus]|uniref:Uncharacterized protein n=1 Tax=Portunus trituberculatus TaxID=210409 RepID=A0A5B7DAZ2_PORTR|nr:hypothetical protein [Portunus trituberculatus]
MLAPESEICCHTASTTAELSCEARRARIVSSWQSSVPLTSPLPTSPASKNCSASDPLLEESARNSITNPKNDDVAQRDWLLDSGRAGLQTWGRGGREYNGGARGAARCVAVAVVAVVRLQVDEQLRVSSPITERSTTKGNKNCD